MKSFTSHRICPRCSEPLDVASSESCWLCAEHWYEIDDDVFCAAFRLGGASACLAIGGWSLELMEWLHESPNNGKHPHVAIREQALAGLLPDAIIASIAKR